MYFTNECVCFIMVSDMTKRMKAAKCFYGFQVFGNPDETHCTKLVRGVEKIITIFSITPHE